MHAEGNTGKGVDKMASGWMQGAEEQEEKPAIHTNPKATHSAGYGSPVEPEPQSCQYMTDVRSAGH